MTKLEGLIDIFFVIILVMLSIMTLLLGSITIFVLLKIIYS